MIKKLISILVIVCITVLIGPSTFLVEAEDSIAEVREKYNQLKETLDEKKEELESVKKQLEFYSSLEAPDEEDLGIIAELRETQEEINNEIRKITEEYSEYKSMLMLVEADSESDSNKTQSSDKTQEYINSVNKINDLTREMAEANKNLSSAQKLAAKYKEDAAKIEVEIADLNVKIDELTEKIDELNAKIDELIARIEENEAKVDALNKRVLERMKSSQGQLHFNPFLDFILGAKGFSDMLRRTYGVEAIMSKEKADREELLDIIEQLNADKQELEEARNELEAAKEELDAAKAELVAKRAEYVVMMDYYNQIVEETRKEIARIQNELEKERRSNELLKKYVSKEAIVSLPSIAGFYSPIPGARISAGAWFYPDGGLHLGVDYAVGLGSPIYAPSNGVILVSYNGCGYGYLGCTCGGDGNGNGVSYGGNQVYMMTSVNNKVYGITFSHLSKAVAARYSIVATGDLIGYVGSSGNSSGPHSHIELFYLGEGDMEDLYDVYLQKNYSLSFNCGWGQAAYNSTRCEVTGGAAPCRLNPANYFGT